jgi:hypothetical protein
MRAFVLDGYGAIADHVRLAEIADPVAGPDDVLGARQGGAAGKVGNYSLVSAIA